MKLREERVLNMTYKSETYTRNLEYELSQELKIRLRLSISAQRKV